MFIWRRISGLYKRWQNWRRFKRRMAELREKDPFIYR